MSDPALVTIPAATATAGPATIAEPAVLAEPAAIAFRIRVLLVDDQRIIAEAIRRMLADHGDIDYHFVTDAAAAVAEATSYQPTVILQDLVMPGMDGFELIELYRAAPALESVPVIVLSAMDEPALKARCFAVGANDYLVKLPDRLELQARVRYHSGGYISALQRDQAFRLLRESQQQLAAANVALERLAALDSLTGIANRRRFDQVLQAEWLRCQREQNPLSLLMCDIDCFKQYNDHFGHPAGDQCLRKAVAVFTVNLKRPADMAARYGGEEFAILLPDTDGAGALAIADACRGGLAALALANPGAAGGYITMSVGVCTIVPSPDSTPDALIARADRALYAAKSGGRNRVDVSVDPTDPIYQKENS